MPPSLVEGDPSNKKNILKKCIKMCNVIKEIGKKEKMQMTVKKIYIHNNKTEKNLLGLAILEKSL